MTAAIHSKSERINVRASAPVKQLLQEAARVAHKNVSEFLLDAGLGKALLKDALMRTAQAADIAGSRALLVHAKDVPARRWSLNWEFEPSASDPFHLFLLVNDNNAMVVIDGRS